MKAERIVLSLIAILIGLFVAGIAFYFFQMTNKKPEEKKQVISIVPTPTTESESSAIELTTPQDQSVSDQETVKITGKAPANSIVVISLESGQDVVVAGADGTFSDSLDLSDGVNLVHISAFSSDGHTESKTYTLSYSTESY